MKNWIVENKEKGFIRYRVANIRKYNPKKKETQSGYTLFAYVYPDKLRIVRIFWYTPLVKGLNHSDYLTIKYKKGNFVYSRDGKRASYQSLAKIFYTGKRSMKKTSLLRLQKIVKDWSESLGHTYTTLPNPTVDTILQRLFWPSLQRIDCKNFSPPTVKRVASLCRQYYTLKDLVRKILGSCGKKTYKLICEKISIQRDTRLDCLLDRLYIFKRVFGNINDIQLAIDRPIYSHISTKDSSCHQPFKTSDIIEYLKCFTKTRLLTENPEELPPYQERFNDSVRMWIQMGRPEIERGISLTDYHDRIAGLQRRKKTPDFPLNPSEELLSIDGFKIEDYTIVVPKTRFELVRWGDRMRNCIASYATKMASGMTNLFGILENEVLIYNVMIENVDILPHAEEYFFGENGERLKSSRLSYRVRQFYGNCNQAVEPKIVNKIIQALPLKIDAGYFGTSTDFVEENLIEVF